MKDTVLVTGAAGFIGFHLCRKLLSLGHHVLGIDNLNDYYDPKLKQDRINQLHDESGFDFAKLDLTETSRISELFHSQQPSCVIHLAAQAGVRYSLTHPYAYVDSNVVGFLNILEGCRHNATSHLIYASSSSVYGKNKKVPFSTSDPVDKPISLYAATKRANELMAYTYSHLYEIPTTGLRFFTVYGPWGRPDMAYFSFTNSILSNQPIRVFNHGDMRRDFTYIDDITEGIVKLMKTPFPNDLVPAYRLYNIGNNQPVSLTDFITTLEKCLGVRAQKEFLPMQPGDVPETYADIGDLMRDTGFAPSTSLDVGLSKFVEWYRSYYNLS